MAKHIIRYLRSLQYGYRLFTMFFPPLLFLLLVLGLYATLWIMEHMLQRLYIYDLARLNVWDSSPIFLTYFDLILNLPP